jgi:hypothetical protein
MRKVLEYAEIAAVYALLSTVALANVLALWGVW